MKPAARVKARGYLEALLRYETILTAQVFLRIFEQTSPVSKYLQTSGMDILTAQCLVMGTKESLRKCARDFDSVRRAADTFVEWANGILQEQQDCEAEVQTALPEKRLRKKKKMPSELAEDEPITDAMRDYEYNLLTDAYHVIGMGYKFLLTLSVTQVACERTFSTLKFVKNRVGPGTSPPLQAGNRGSEGPTFTQQLSIPPDSYSSTSS
ncbi:hypothetical protein SKAU_G00092550 [Synaphobranchus kaupii]|uniref:HAT C-terminal dimerisation domain-containing protein n=1 Tax=Synaphobranchus kaupii TaxID=118154 RepID=A0A9Q1J5J6_SYNKA|nr:hypothetical protein SKAU_G00092550 [Synaphobranchus kaupii]